MRNRFAGGLLVAFLLVLGVGLAAHASDLESRLVTRSVLRTHSDESTMDVSAAVYTAWIPLVTITPPAGVAMEDVRVVVDLDKATTGFAEGTGWDTETMQLSIARAVDGTNFHTAHNLITPGTALAADNSDDLTLEIVVGDVGPTEKVKVMIKVSAEAAADAVFPYVVTYKSSERATFTDVDP